jgi:hypothetical protein
MTNLRSAISAILLLSFAPACLPSIIESADDSTGTDGSDADPNLGEGVELGAAGEFVILAKSEISTLSPSAFTGDVALSPAGATFITGLSLTMDPTSQFATSPQVLGNVYSADYAAPTPSDLSTAVEDMELAFADAAGRVADTTDLGAGELGGLMLAPGVYEWGTDLSIATDVTLDGSATDVWIFQISRDLVISSDAEVVLSGGAEAKNVFWQVGGSVDIGAAAHCVGIILTKTSATLRSGASLDGRLLAQTTVDVQSSTVVEPE